MPSYAELQKGEIGHALDHVGHGVPDLRMAALRVGYERLVASELPIARDDVNRLRDFAPDFTELCAALAQQGIQESVQHDDLHMRNLYSAGGKLRIVDWGDSSIAHPFFSLLVMFRFLEEFNHLAPFGSEGCATLTWSRGGADWKRLLKSRSASAGLRMRSHGLGSGMHCHPRHGQISTKRSRSSCGGRSLRRATSRRPVLPKRGGETDVDDAVSSQRGVRGAAAPIAGDHRRRART